MEEKYLPEGSFCHRKIGNIKWWFTGYAYLTQYSGGIFFINSSPVEKNEDNLMLTWNSDIKEFKRFN
jgi:hypothetical protein